MKMLKKLLAVICSLTMAVSMVSTVQAATIDNPLSLSIVDNTKTDNTVTINVKTTFDSLKGGSIAIKIPTALQSYISGWDWFSALEDNSSIPTLDDTYSYKKGSNTTSQVYGINTLTSSSGNAFEAPADDVIVSLKLTLVEGGVPSTVSAADRTITLGGDYKASYAKTGATYITDAAGTTYYLYRADDSKSAPTNNFTYDPTATGNYVVVPAAEAEEEGPAYEGYVGDDDETDVAVGATFDFVPEETTTGIKWTVETNDGVKKSHVSAIDAAGAASYKLGLVIQGLAKSAVKSISAVLQ